ncbi:MAG: 5-formyltetrahydrofolate cyclo-ligase [Chitinispirillia bacterium]|nr:5-formyltetrahydrofolate cyclo-ligase [Chitinispirillia bacterium]
MNDEKENLRSRYISARKSMSPADAERYSARIATNIFSLPRILDSDLILIYCAAGAEVDTATLADLIVGSGRGIAFPYCRKDGSIGIGRVFSPRDEDLAPGALGIMEPIERLRDNIDPGQLDAVVCPGVAFDRECGRLGRGGGYYDRFLQELKGKAYLVGCAYDCQISDDPLPRDGHDIAMDAVVTEVRAFPGGSCPALNPDGGEWGENADRVSRGIRGIGFYGGNAIT